MILTNLTDFSPTVTPWWEFFNRSVVVKDVPVVFREPGKLMSVVILCNPGRLGNVWLRRSSGCVFQPGVSKRPA